MQCVTTNFWGLALEHSLKQERPRLIFWFFFFIQLADQLVIAFNLVYNIASKFVSSNSIARACFIFLLCTLMTSANKSLEKKNFLRVENVIKQLVLRQLCVHRDMKHLGSLGFSFLPIVTLVPHALLEFHFVDYDVSTSRTLRILLRWIVTLVIRAP